MGLEPDSVHFDDKRTHLENVEVVKTMAVGTSYVKELEDYRKRCLELEEKSKRAEMRCFVLEVEVGNLKKKNEMLEEQLTRVQKDVGEGEKGKGAIIDLTDEEKDETELETWKEKAKELALRVCELESKVNMKSMNDSSMGMGGTLMVEDRVKEASNMVSTHKTAVAQGEIGAKQEFHSQIRKRLPFEEDGYANKKIAPSTPGVAQLPFTGFIDISDEDTNTKDLERITLEHGDEEDMACFEGHSPVIVTAKRRRASKIVTSDDENGEEDMDGFKGCSSNTVTAKGKRASKVITSDDETSYDDNAPICTLRMQHSRRLKADSEDEVKEDVRRPRLKRLRKSETEDRQDRNTFDLSKTVCLYGNASSDDEEDNDGVENNSESEGESLGGFIIASSESSSDSASESDESCDEAEDALDDFKVTLDKIRRKRVSNLKWDLEGDMLADFGKDPELCMRAVCALYRQQTADEKLSKGTIHLNERGFSQCDATRGSRLAEFLMDGDSGGDLKRTVDELEGYDSKGIKLCMALATKYSKQLFEIYRNKEDPYFRPP